MIWFVFFKDETKLKTLSEIFPPLHSTDIDKIEEYEEECSLRINSNPLSVLPWSLGNRSNVTSRIETHFQAIRETFFQKGCINFKFQLRLLSRTYIHVHSEEFSKKTMKLFAEKHFNSDSCPKYSKHWLYLLTYTMDCDCSKILIHSKLNLKFRIKIWIAVLFKILAFILCTS